MRTRTLILSSVITLALNVAVVASAQVTTPPGWKAQNQSGATMLTPGNLPAGKAVTVLVFPPQPLNGQNLQAWTDKVVQQGVKQYGKVLQAGKLTFKEPYWTSAQLVEVNGKPMILNFYAFPAGTGKAQLVTMLMSSDETLVSRYAGDFAGLLTGLIKGSTATVATKPTVSSGNSAVNPSGKPGGPLKFGTYNCRRVRTSGGLPPRDYSLNIYSNGEWRQLIDGREVKTSVYKYDSQTGKIDISYDLNIRNAMFESDADEEFAYFMADKSGAAIIYAEDDYGLGITKTTCIYAGPNTLPTPQQVDANAAKVEAAKAAEREKERNRYRTAPNAGLKLSQIATIVHHFSSRYDGQNTNVQETDTLLLNDGTAYLNLRWTPHDLDVKASRAGEPKEWTRWRKQGGQYQILTNGKWVKLEGLATAPFSKNERLTGAYSYKSYYQVGWFDNASVSYSESNYYFAQNGTFDRGGMARTTGGTDMGGVKTSGVAQTNNAGSSGTYTVDGYTLQLKYGNGQVVRSYGFFWSGDKSKLVINGTTYNR